MAKRTVTVNRAPVLTLWAAVVAERLGFAGDAALTLGKAVAGLTAQSKGRSLGIYKPPSSGAGKHPKKHGLGDEFRVELCGRTIPARNTDDGVRAVVKEKPITPDEVQRYLDRAFGDDLPRVRQALEALAGTFKSDQLAERAFGLYESFRPAVARGTRGWGQKGELDLDLIRSLGPKC